MTLTGILRHRDLGTGAWVLEAADGTVVDLHLAGVSPKVLQRSRDRAVVLEGELAEPGGGGMGFGMAGTRSFTVRRVSQA